MTGIGEATWIGVLDLDGEGAVTGIRSEHPLTSYARARVLVRLHHAPVGYVEVPARPELTLTQRVRTAAAATLAEPLQRHTGWDEARRAAGDSFTWPAVAACPDRFPDPSKEGLTVVICTRDRPESLRDCLQALAVSSHHRL